MPPTLPLYLARDVGSSIRPYIIIIIIIIILKCPFFDIYFVTLSLGARSLVQWLRYCATNRKVVGSIPNGVIGIFH
jgi:hypothetical protein